MLTTSGSKNPSRIFISQSFCFFKLKFSIGCIIENLLIMALALTTFESCNDSSGVIPLARILSLGITETLLNSGFSEENVAFQQNMSNVLHFC